ncbi:hypothetical protein F4780DRAFT_51174 [Xylariomycetidae sp. FL0641]|nr:hypothetical protein F4780DRAFT_51174 [Xylariomycetidae sp. FL0641]
MGATASIPTDPSRTMQVISAGYSRTGTLTMCLALEKLLDGPIHHGGTQLVARENEHNRTWIKAFEARDAGDHEAALKHVRKVTAGYVGITDLPGIAFLPELLELYPDAKVVLVRRDPVKWWKSLGVLMAVVPAWLPVLMAPVPGWRYIPKFINIYTRDMLKMGGTLDSNAKGIDGLTNLGGPRLLETWNEYVRSLVPKERLLEMELREGWEPLCKFLDKPIPNEPLPHANDAKAAEEYAKKVLTKSLLVWAGILSVSGSALYGGFWMWRDQMA